MNKKEIFTRRYKVFLAFFIIGVLLAIAGLTIQLLNPDVDQPVGQWMLSLAIFFICISLFNLVRYYRMTRDETTAKRAWAENNDERSVSIRNQAGYAAFLFYLVLSSGTLMVYSGLTRHSPGVDWLWFYLAFTVLGPTMFFIAYLYWLQKRK